MNPNVPQEVRIINAISEQLFNSWPVSIIMIDLEEVGSINSIFYFLHKAAEPFNCLEQDNLA